MRVRRDRHNGKWQLENDASDNGQHPNQNKNQEHLHRKTLSEIHTATDRGAWPFIFEHRSWDRYAGTACQYDSRNDQKYASDHYKQADQENHAQHLQNVTANLAERSTNAGRPA